MIWSQSVARGVLKEVGEGRWSGQTFCASVIRIGTQSLENVCVAGCLLEQMQVGSDMELLICSAHIYGVRVNGNTYKEGAFRQLGWALLIAIPLGWLVLPLMLSLVYVRRFYAIQRF